MTKTLIHCVRHAQGYHNLNVASHALLDPLLTPLGKEQCATLAADFPHEHRDRITHLVASPLRRTLYTALLSFPSLVSKGHKVIALPELQESSAYPCDTGSPRATLEAEFSTGEFAGTCDFALVPEGWNSKTGKWDPRSSALAARAAVARRWLRDLARRGGGGQEIVVVTHGAFLHYLTGDWHGSEAGAGWTNTEFRSYEFVSETDEEASVRETEKSRKRRGHDHPLSEAEQRGLRDAREREWAAEGYLSADV